MRYEACSRLEPSSAWSLWIWCNGRCVRPWECAARTYRHVRVTHVISCVSRSNYVTMRYGARKRDLTCNQTKRLTIKSAYIFLIRSFTTCIFSVRFNKGDRRVGHIAWGNKKKERLLKIRSLQTICHFWITGYLMNKKKMSTKRILIEIKKETVLRVLFDINPTTRNMQKYKEYCQLFSMIVKHGLLHWEKNICYKYLITKSQ